jgi:hypothetical protein
MIEIMVCIILGIIATILVISDKKDKKVQYKVERIEEFAIINQNTRELMAKVDIRTGKVTLASGYNIIFSKGEKIDYKEIDGKFYLVD